MKMEMVYDPLVGNRELIKPESKHIMTVNEKRVYLLHTSLPNIP